VGYWGVSLGGAIGVPLVAAEPRITAAVFGLVGQETLAEAAAQVSVPVQFLLQWTTNWYRVTRGWRCSVLSAPARRRCTPTPAVTGRYRVRAGGRRALLHPAPAPDGLRLS